MNAKGKSETRASATTSAMGRESRSSIHCGRVDDESDHGGSLRARTRAMTSLKAAAG